MLQYQLEVGLYIEIGEISSYFTETKSAVLISGFIDFSVFVLLKLVEVELQL